MGDAVDEDGIEAGVGEDDFIGGMGSGVAIEGGLDIEGEELAEVREFFEKLVGEEQGLLVAMVAGLIVVAFSGGAVLFVADGFADLFVEEGVGLGEE